MASIINALSSGTGGIVTSGDASGILQFQTANTAAVTIDGSQNVGIGTSSPGSGVRLDVVGGEIRAGRVDSSYEGGQVSFSRSTDNTTAWYIDLYGNTSTPLFRVVDVGGSAVALSLSSSGTLALRGASSSSGVGISFPGTQVASSDANTLDDYEEGTWTPTLRGSGSNPTVSSSSVSGWYTKVGNLVTLSFSCNFTFSGGSGSVWIGNMPFTPTALSIGTLENGGVTMGGSYTYGGTLADNGLNYLELRKYSNANSGESGIAYGQQSSGVWVRTTISFKTS